jgi:transcriptional regulator with XRE-family HTH domain
MRLRELRRARSWTQADAAERLGVLLRDYQAIEGGHRNVTVRTLVALANAFETDVHELFVSPERVEKRRAGRPTKPLPILSRLVAECGARSKRG